MKTSVAICLISIACSLTAISDVAAQENHVRKEREAPGASIARNPVKLASYLTQGDTSQRQMAWHLYEWVTRNIVYDVKAFRKAKPKHFTVKQTLKRKKGVCYQYSELYETLCRNAGISAHNILGYSKGAGHFDGNIFYEVDHSWNGVKLDSSWYLVDATWGSGALVLKQRKFKKWLSKLFGSVYINDRYKFLHEPTDRYFMADPKTMINDHMPLDSSWQLLDHIVPLQVFETGQPDTSKVRKVPPLKYQQWLGDYEYLSKLQYGDRTAHAAFRFNRRNTGQLGFSTYNRSNSHQLKYLDNRDENELKQAKKLLKESVSHFNRQNQQAILACRKMRNHARKGVRQSLRRPNTMRQKSANGQLKTATNFLNAKFYNKSRETMARSLRQLDERIKNMVPKSIKSPKPGKVKKPDLVEKNLEKLEQYAGRLQDDPDSLDHLYASIERIGGLRTSLISKLIMANQELGPLVQQVSLTIQNNAQFPEVVESMRFVENQGEVIDSLKRSLGAQISNYREMSNQAKQMETNMRAVYQQALKLITENSQFSEEGHFDRISYRKYERAIRKLPLFRRRVIFHHYQLIEKEVVLYAQLAEAIADNQDALVKNQDYVELYEKKWLASIDHKEQFSRYQYDRMIALARNRLSKLP